MIIIFTLIPPIDFESILISLQISIKTLFHLLSLLFLLSSSSPTYLPPVNFLFFYQGPFSPLGLWPGCPSLCLNHYPLQRRQIYSRELQVLLIGKSKRGSKKTFLLLRLTTSWHNSCALWCSQCLCCSQSCWRTPFCRTIWYDLRPWRGWEGTLPWKSAME